MGKAKGDAMAAAEAFMKCLDQRRSTQAAAKTLTSKALSTMRMGMLFMRSSVGAVRRNAMDVVE